MRIVGGRLKGRPLAGPKGDGGAARLRPTSDRMRESIFNILAHGDYPDIEGARVLDLFAGTGALGLEALSRGAARALFVDDGTEARAIIRRNIEALGVIGQTKLYRLFVDLHGRALSQGPERESTRVCDGGRLDRGGGRDLVRNCSR